MSKHGNRKGKIDYITKTLLYLVILLAITIITVFVTIKPVTKLVHGIENNMCMSVRDIRLKDEAFENCSAKSADEVILQYGDRVATITSDDFSLNSAVYYGANRASMSAGTGLSGKYDLFASGGTSLVCGYMQDSFSGLDYAEVGDRITVTASYGEYSYRIYDIKYITEEADFKDLGKDKLVLEGLTSDFSEHSGETLYVFADLTDGEVK